MLTSQSPYGSSLARRTRQVGPRRRSQSAGVGPTEFASRDPLPDEARFAPRYPKPSRLNLELRFPGEKAEKAGEKLGLDDVGALLDHIPRDRRAARTLAELTPDETATVVVEVRSITSRPVRRRGMKPLVEARVADETGTMPVTFFNQPWLERRYRPGHAAAADRQARRAAAARLRRHRARRDRRAGDHRRGHGDLPGLRRAVVGADRGAGARAPRRPPATCSSRCRRGCGCSSASRTAGRRWTPPTSATRRAAAGGWRSTSSCCCRSRCCAAASGRREGARAAALEAAGRADGALAARTRCRSRPPATSGSRWRRSTRTSSASGRCSGC